MFVGKTPILNGNKSGVGWNTTPEVERKGTRSWLEIIPYLAGTKCHLFSLVSNGCKKPMYFLVFTVLVFYSILIKQQHSTRAKGHRMKNGKLRSTTPTSLLPLPADVDLVRFETNLLQIGFFSAHDPRTKSTTTSRSWRRLEQTVTRDGQRIKVTAEFRSSELLGLPSTADRDKFLALMKIVSEERARIGKVQNPIRFSGYRLLKELGLSDSGQNYEEISTWGRRMADTTITSERVIYFSARKRYSDKTIHVFRSFQRVGESNLDDSDRSEAYEIELEDWLLENLNHGYVIPEDFRAYKKLTRPTAKGIFGNLHLWFHASQGRAVEKDYAELCNFLNVRVYPHASKIKETMGQSLDELVGVGYLSSWQLQPMSTKKGFKIVMLPGDELLRVISLSQKKQLGDRSSGSAELSVAQQLAVDALLEHGILPAKAKMLVQQYDPEQIVDQVEYAQTQIFSGSHGRQKIDNPAGFIIYNIENGLPVPATFLTTRKRKELDTIREQRELEMQYEATLQIKYMQWKEGLVNAELEARYSGSQLSRVLGEIISKRMKSDPQFKRMSMNKPGLETLALSYLRKELLEELMVPSYDDWKKEQRQGELF